MATKSTTEKKVVPKRAVPKETAAKKAETKAAPKKKTLQKKTPQKETAARETAPRRAAQKPRPAPGLLPPPVELERICKGLAALDAMLSEDWEARYYSFNRSWFAGGQQRLASMRNGSGDDWFIVFAPGGVFVKSFWHEYRHEDVSAIYDGLPPLLAPLLTEPSFLMEDVTFGGWCDGKTWTLRGNAKPMAEELAMLTGDPERYRAHVAEYFEVQVPREAIAHVLAGKPLDAKLVAQITETRTLPELKSDLAEIGYGT